MHMLAIDTNSLLFIVTIYTICSKECVFLPFSSHVEKKSSPAGSRVLYRGGKSICFLQGDLEQVSCCSVCVHMLCTLCTYAINLHTYQSFLTSGASFRIFRSRRIHGQVHHSMDSIDHDESMGHHDFIANYNHFADYQDAVHNQESTRNTSNNRGTQITSARTIETQATLVITTGTQTVRARRKSKHCHSPVTTAAYKRETSFRYNFSLLSSSKHSVSVCSERNIQLLFEDHLRFPAAAPSGCWQVTSNFQLHSFLVHK